MAWVERNLKGHLGPAPCQGQRYLPLDQVAPIPTQSGLKHFQGEFFPVNSLMTIYMHSRRTSIGYNSMIVFKTNEICVYI